MEEDGDRDGVDGTSRRLGRENANRDRESGLNAVPLGNRASFTRAYRGSERRHGDDLGRSRLECERGGSLLEERSLLRQGDLGCGGSHVLENVGRRRATRRGLDQSVRGDGDDDSRLVVYRENDVIA